VTASGDEVNIHPQSSRRLTSEHYGKHYEITARGVDFRSPY
jgi:hypothetical protein